VTVRAALALAAIGVFLGSWSLLHHGMLARDQIVDTGEYETYGDGVMHGQVPYRDFRLEYTPGALPMFILPAIGHEGNRDAYDRWFDRLMALCGCMTIAGVSLALAALGAGKLRTILALGLVALSPLLVGSVALSRYDLWPAALAVLALAALLWNRLTLGAVVLAAAIAAKLWPAVIAPVAIAWIWRTRGRRAALRWTATLVAVDAVIFLPFAVLSPGGLAVPFRDQLARPLQLESIGSAILLTVHHGAMHLETTYGSQNLTGSGAHLAAVLTTVLEIAALAAVWIVFARGPATGERLVRYAAAAAAAFLAFGKVFSPQYVIWLVPLVPLVRGRRGLAAGGLLAVILLLTQSWFPRRYWQLAQQFASTQRAELLARDLCVVALALLLTLEPRRERVP
jgi:hypothetical protein